jgi:hypothetical protein
MKPPGKPSKDVRAEHKHEQELPIQRHAAGASLGSLVTEAAMQQRLDDAQRYGERSALTAAMLQPIFDLIQADPAAAEAARRLGKLARSIPASIPQQRLASGAGGAGGSPPGPVTIGPGVSVFTHPYDHAQVGPDTSVPEPSSSAKVLSGALHVEGIAVDFLEYDGSFFAIAGLGFDLETRRDGTLEVRPVAMTAFKAFARGVWLDAYVEGHVTTTVLNAATQTHVAPPTDYRLFALHSDGDVDDGVNLGGNYLAVRFQARAKTAYQVWMTASVWGNQSGWSRPFSGSSAGGTIDVSFPIVAAELS